MNRAYYNENDPFAAEWLRELIRKGHIAPGEVDTRSIEDVVQTDLTGFTQCHFFAGIGVWSYALRLAGWPDNSPVWTGSCPCPPFSAAGKNKACPKCGGRNPLPHAFRTGVFRCTACGHDWYADGRHLWPEFYRLIRECRPSRVFGEQVANRDGEAWGDIVQSTLELEDYTVGRVTYASCGVGAPHMRQRLYWVADSGGVGFFPGRHRDNTRHDWGEPEPNGQDGWMADTESAEPQTGVNTRGRGDGFADNRDFLRLAHAHHGGRENGQLDSTGVAGCRRGRGYNTEDGAAIAQCCASGGVANTAGYGQQGACQGCGAQEQRASELCLPCESELLAPTNGHWETADWLYCTDGKWRPVDPGTFPLAHGAPARVGRLRGYGNAINPYQAKEFVKAYILQKQSISECRAGAAS